MFSGVAKQAKAAPKTLGSAIRQVREQGNLTQAELARELGVSQNVVGRLESGGRKDPRLSTMLGVSAVLGISLDELAAIGGLIEESSPKKGTAPKTIELLRRVRDAKKALTKTVEALEDLERSLIRRTPPKRTGG